MPPSTSGRRRKVPIETIVGLALLVGLGLVVTLDSGCHGGGGRYRLPNTCADQVRRDAAARIGPSPIAYSVPDGWHCGRQPVAIVCGPIQPPAERPPVVLAWYPQPGRDTTPSADLAGDMDATLAYKARTAVDVRSLRPSWRTTFAGVPAVTYDIGYREAADDGSVWAERHIAFRTPTRLPMRVVVQAEAAGLDTVAGSPETRALLVTRGR